MAITEHKHMRESVNSGGSAFTCVFVYGTLKRGEENHHVIRRRIVHCRPAALFGTLYRIPEGYPGLDLPLSSILLQGSSDLRADAAAELACRPRSAQRAVDPPEDCRDRIVGELMFLNHPIETLALLDRFEDFSPDGESLYHRVLTWCTPAAGSGQEAERLPAWVYIIPREKIGRADRWNWTT